MPDFTRTIQILMGNGICHLEENDIKEAIGFFTEVIILCDKFPEAYEYLAKCYIRLVRTYINRKASMPC